VDRFFVMDFGGDQGSQECRVRYLDPQEGADLAIFAFHYRHLNRTFLRWSVRHRIHGFDKVTPPDNLIPGLPQRPRQTALEIQPCNPTPDEDDLPPLRLLGRSLLDVHELEDVADALQHLGFAVGGRDEAFGAVDGEGGVSLEGRGERMWGVLVGGLDGFGGRGVRIGGR